MQLLEVSTSQSPDAAGVPLVRAFAADVPDAGKRKPEGPGVAFDSLGIAAEKCPACVPCKAAKLENVSIAIQTVWGNGENAGHLEPKRRVFRSP